LGKIVVSGIMFTLLLVGMLTLAFNVQPASSEWTGTVYIRADGSIDPPDAPIQRDGNVYTLTGNITSDADGIVVERDNIILDGNGYMLQGTGAYLSRGMYLLGRSNLTIRNTSVRNFWWGITLNLTSKVSICGNYITNTNGSGIMLDRSSNNSISRNTITNNDGEGIYLGTAVSFAEPPLSDYNIITENNITNNQRGIYLYQSSNNTIAGNNIANNRDDGIGQHRSYRNSIRENNITNNRRYGIYLDYSGRNTIYWNNLINNTNQISIWHEYYANTWDDGYPSGGNYWSDYTGVDEFSGPHQNVTGKDWIGDTPYVINAKNRDRYPLMRPWPLLHHELVVSITAPVYLQLGSSLSLNAIVKNEGLNDEADVEFSLLINSTTINSTTISLLRAEASYTLSYMWTPTIEGTYNVTAYVKPVPNETKVENNRMTKFVTVSALPPSEVQVGVKAGDWIKFEYTVSGWPAGQPRPEWLKVEFLSVEGTSATVRVTMRMSDGTEQSDTVPVDVVAGGGEAFGLSGFVIPANLKSPVKPREPMLGQAEQWFTQASRSTESSLPITGTSRQGSW